MGSKVNRVGEENINNFGSKMIIVGYRMNNDIDVYFPEYNWVAKNKEYKKFKNGNIKCLYERRFFSVGYLGEGEYKMSENGKHTKCCVTWKSMLERCYDTKYKEKHLTYIDCEVCEEWHNFQNFAEWYYKNYYEVENETMCLDKDILNKGNKVYSPENCVFVPQIINKLFTKNNINRGEYPVGVSYRKDIKKFRADCSIYDFKENKSKSKHLGLYETPVKAFEAYKRFKEKHIKKVAEYYKEQIPKNLYDALYEYEVEITD